jgi:hypothetical protein
VRLWRRMRVRRRMNPSLASGDSLGEGESEPSYGKHCEGWSKLYSITILPSGKGPPHSVGFEILILNYQNSIQYTHYHHSPDFFVAEEILPEVEKMHYHLLCPK